MSTRPVVIWTGPVNFTQVPGATLSDAYEINIGCFGDRDPYCPGLAASYLTGGRRLPQILARAGVPPESEVGDIAIGAFSAGGSLVKRLLLSEPDRARIQVVHLADATWTSSWDDQRARIPPYGEGFVLYALDAIAGAHLFVVTASPNPNKTWATGIENLRRLRSEVERRSGERFTELDHFFGIEPGPDHVYQLGNVILAEFPSKPLGHGHTVIAGPVWDRIIKPWLASDLAQHRPLPGQRPDPWTSPDPSVVSYRALGAGALGLVIGYIGVRWIYA